MQRAVIVCQDGVIQVDDVPLAARNRIKYDKSYKSYGKSYDSLQ